MLRKVLLFLCFMASVMADAQYKVSSIDKQDTDRTKLLQVLETEKSVLVYCTFTRPDSDTNLFWLNRKLKAVKNNVNYKIVNAVNFPLMNEAEPRYVRVTKAGEKVNYVLEFEKFDVSGGFDIIDDDTKHEAGTMNFYGIHLEKIEPNEAIDTDRFLDDGHVIYGYYKKNNRTYRYYIKDGMMMLFYNTWYGKDLIINLEITNNSDHGVMFDLAKLSTEGTDKKGKAVEVAVYTPDSYDARVESDRYYNARQQTSDDVTRTAESLLYQKRINTKNEWGNLGLRALEGVLKRAEDNRVDKYLKEHPNTAPKALRSNSIQPGESLRGFIPLKIKKSKNVKLHIPMDDYDFLINYDIN